MKKIKLLKSHEHQGVLHDAGIVLDVSDADANFLLQHRIGEAVKNPSSQAVKDATVPSGTTESAELNNTESNIKTETEKEQHHE